VFLRGGDVVVLVFAASIIARMPTLTGSGSVSQRVNRSVKSPEGLSRTSGSFPE